MENRRFRTNLATEGKKQDLQKNTLPRNLAQIDTDFFNNLKAKHLLDLLDTVH
jgi:hypothetical protein